MPKNLLSRLPNKKYIISVIGKNPKINIWELNTMINLLYKHNDFTIKYYIIIKMINEFNWLKNTVNKNKYFEK